MQTNAQRDCLANWGPKRFRYNLPEGTTLGTGKAIQRKRHIIQVRGGWEILPSGEDLRDMYALGRRRGRRVTEYEKRLEREQQRAENETEAA